MLRNIYKYIVMRSESTNSNLTSFLLWDRCLAFPQMASSLFLVNGKLSQWSEWTRCDKLCEHGKEKRYKTCSNPKPRCGGKNCDLSISVEEERPCVYCPGNYNAMLEHVLKGFLDLEQCPTLNFSFPCATNSIMQLIRSVFHPLQICQVVLRSEQDQKDCNIVLHFPSP